MALGDSMTHEDGATFDYVIIGAGSAGCVLANRLSENPANTVCLVEAGPPDTSFWIHIPVGTIELFNHKVLNWRFSSVEQAHVAGRKIGFPRGKTLGGTSAINGMVYARGHRLDYDDWAAAGNVGWSYKEILPYFLRSENNERWPEGPYHHRGGLLNVQDIQEPNALNEVLFQAADSLQLKRNEDSNGAEQEGFGVRQVNIKNGRRHSTAKAFLDPARQRSNLKIITEGLVSRVLVKDGRAQGVQLSVGGEVQTLSARKEVVLSAGAIGSPEILLRSGIGPTEELARHGIAVTHALPGVGENLQDHIAAVLQYLSPSTVPYGISLRSLPWLAKNLFRYITSRKGIFGSTPMESAGFVKLDPTLDRPDIQYMFLPAHRSPVGRSYEIGHGYSMTTVLLRPESRGHVRLSGRDAHLRPLIDPKFFSAPSDLEHLARGVELGRKLLNAPQFAPYKGEEIWPGNNVQSTDELYDAIRSVAKTVFHPSGTCKMGVDDMAVVDPTLKVRGIEGLRVVDASIMPNIIGGNTNAPVIMIAEKAADMILGKPALPAADV